MSSEEDRGPPEYITIPGTGDLDLIILAGLGLVLAAAGIVQNIVYDIEDASKANVPRQQFSQAARDTTSTSCDATKIQWNPERNEVTLPPGCKLAPPTR